MPRRLSWRREPAGPAVRDRRGACKEHRSGGPRAAWDERRAGGLQGAGDRRPFGNQRAASDQRCAWDQRQAPHQRHAGHQRRGSVQRRAWDQRAARYGLRAAFNLGHSATDLDRVTEEQARLVVPHLERALAAMDGAPGHAMRVLDFGCGWGRWCERLAHVTGGTVIGVDPTRHFVAEARRRYRSQASTHFLVADGMLPLRDSSIDVVWTFGVMNTITDERSLAVTAFELGRVTRPGGLLFLVDITTTSPHRRQRRTHLSVLRAPQDYVRAFSGWVDLAVVGGWLELGETNEILLGYKRA